MNLEYVIGIDEAGRGPIFGPVVAAAVFLEEKIVGIDDSKKLSAKKREVLFEKILEDGKVGIGIANVEEIDIFNIFHATELAMNRALENLNCVLEVEKCDILVDGKNLKLKYPARCIVKGDSKVYQISAASIIAKVYRDRLISNYEKEFSGFNFKKHKGYPTKEHLEEVKKNGVTLHHRFSFEPILELIAYEKLLEFLENGLISTERFKAIYDRKLRNSKQLELFGGQLWK